MLSERADLVVIPAEQGFSLEKLTYCGKLFLCTHEELEVPLHQSQPLGSVLVAGIRCRIVVAELGGFAELGAEFWPGKVRSISHKFRMEGVTP